MPRMKIQKRDVFDFQWWDVPAYDGLPTTVAMRMKNKLGKIGDGEMRFRVVKM